MGCPCVFSRQGGRHGGCAARLRRVVTLLWGCGLVLAASQPLAAGPYGGTDAPLRAAYLINFIKYVDWPGEAMTATICLYGPDRLGPHLARHEGSRVRGRSVHIRRVRRFDPLAGCQVLYVTDADPQRQAALLEAVARLPVLTVAETPAFVRCGGAIALLRQDNRMVFVVDAAAIGRAGLRVSPQMLRLAVEGGAR